MNKINALTYEENGVTICFKLCSMKEDGQTEKYSFKVLHDEFLTRRLNSAVREKTIKFQNIPSRVTSLFSMIKSNSFNKIISGDGASNLYEKFQKEFGKSPEFITKNLSKKGNPCFYSEFKNVEVLIIGVGTTEKSARIDLLRKYFDSII